MSFQPTTWTGLQPLDHLLRAHAMDLVRFSAVGLAGVAVNLVTYGLLVHRVGLPPAAAAIASFAVALTHNFALNRNWTFRAHRAASWRQGARFAAVSVAALGLNLAALTGLLGAGLAELPAQLAAIAVATPASFAGHRMWSFRSKAAHA